MTRRPTGKLLWIPLAALLAIPCGCGVTAKQSARPDGFVGETEAEGDRHEPAATLSPSPTVPGNLARVAMAYPTGSRSTSVLWLEKALPSEVQVGSPFDYSIEVTNLTRLHLTNVTITDQLSPHFRLESATPKVANLESGKACWRLGDLAAGETRAIRVNGSVTEAGPLVASTGVAYDAHLLSSITAVRPALELTVRAPQEVFVCDEIPIEYRLANVGTGTAHRVKVESDLPESLRPADLRPVLAFELESMAPGETRVFSAALKACRGGEYAHRARASGEGGLEAEALGASTTVLQPALEISCEAPLEQHLGKPFTYAITVKNKGSGSAANAAIENPLPAGSELVEASDGGQLVDGKVIWQLAGLDAGERKTVTLAVRGGSPGVIRNVSIARADCSRPSTAYAETMVSGFPSLVVDVADVADPTKVGETETYIVALKNRGTARATGIRINCELEESMEYVSASGPTSSWAEGRLVSFAPLDELKSGEETRWRLVVKATKKGGARFTAKLTSDQTAQPVVETETSTFYE